jgi:hypothetical protein
MLLWKGHIKKGERIEEEKLFSVGMPLKYYENH